MNFKTRIKTVAINIAIAFFFSSIFVVIYFFTIEGKVHSYVSLINMTAVEAKETDLYDFDIDDIDDSDCDDKITKTEEVENKEKTDNKTKATEPCDTGKSTKTNSDGKLNTHFKLIKYPDLGVKFATISIPSIDLKLPVYHGDTNKILRKGIGHYGGSYFPGENGTIILAGHNYETMFRNIDYIKKKDIITLKTTYGTFKYKVYDMKIVKSTDLKAFEIQQKEERLILYSCYPLHQRTFRKTQRYVVYAKKVSDNLD